MQLTFTLGDLLQLGATLGGLLALYVTIRDRLTRLETKLDPMWHEWVTEHRLRRGDDPRPGRRA